MVINVRTFDMSLSLTYSSVFRQVIVLAFVLAFATPSLALNDNCGIQADSDILGLGVRLGIYFQLASNIYIGVVHPKEAEGSFPITNILMTGIFVSLVYSTVHNGFPSGAMICALWLVPLDLPLIVPILTTGIVREESEIAMSFSTASVTLLRFSVVNYGSFEPFGDRRS